jgi:hypothetical protein
MADKSNASQSPKYKYAEKLKDPRWQKLRLQVFERDGWRCRVCDQKDNTLHAHHTYYDNNTEGPWDYPQETIVTLCDTCHEKEHAVLPAVRNNLVKRLSADGFVTSLDLMFLTMFIDDIKKAIDQKGHDKEWMRNISTYIEYKANNKKIVVGGDL